MPTPTSFDDCPANLLRKDNDYHVIPRPKAAPQGGFSCPFGAIHLLGISWQAVPNCNISQEIATPLAGLAMTEET